MLASHPWVGVRSAGPTVSHQCRHHRVTMTLVPVPPVNGPWWAPATTPSMLPLLPVSWRPVAIGRTQGTVVVTLEGVLDGSGTAWLKGVLADLIEGQGNKSVAVNLAGVWEIHPTVLRLFAAISAQATIRGGHFAVRDPSAIVAERLAQSGLTVEPDPIHRDQSPGLSGRATGRREK